MSKRAWNPKKFVVHREWAPKNEEIDEKVSDVEKDNKYKAGKPFVIDGKPFIWTDEDSAMVKRIFYSKPSTIRKSITDYIEDGMNGDNESFNW